MSCACFRKGSNKDGHLVAKMATGLVSQQIENAKAAAESTTQKEKAKHEQGHCAQRVFKL